MEQRKHISQMDREEVGAILTAVRSNRDYPPTPYASSRVIGRRLPKNFLSALLSYGKPIEVHSINGDIRVLLRGKVQGQGVCAVLSLTNKVLITAYINDGVDHHQTLDLAQYNWNVKISLDKLVQFC